MIEIKNRWTSEVMFSEDVGTLRDAVVRLVANRTNLSDAYLRDADLSSADLSDAYLRDADLSSADLSGADLSDADLSSAYLRDADLSSADLSGADLSDAYLRDAYLRDADLSSADLSDAYLRDADLSSADLSGADLSDAYLRGAYGVNKDGAIENEPTPEEYAQRMVEFRERNPDVPVVPLLDATICKIVYSGEGKLQMNDWHTCETTHCRAGWAIHLAGEEGAKLEEKHGPERAGAMIYKASTGRYPDFFASNEDALADICKWGALEHQQ